MPWKEVTQMKQRHEFIQFAKRVGANISQLCKCYGISRKTAYKWLDRYEKEGEKGLYNQSRRPKNSPKKTRNNIEQIVTDLRREHPAWGGRKLAARLQAKGHVEVPHASTVTHILHRHGLISKQASEQATAWKRFEHPSPNDLWQMDFKGHFPLGESRCHPLTILDDHSRFSLCLQACLNEQRDTVQAQLIEVFRRYGLPHRMNMDNGSPWGHSQPMKHRYTVLSAWMIRLGIKVSYSRPKHPQTNGKDERFHRTLKAEVLQYQSFSTLWQAQGAFDKWRYCYNHERPHEAISMQTPIQRYKVSQRIYPETLKAIEYGPQDLVRKVQKDGVIFYKNRCFKVGKAFYTQPVALRHTTSDHLFDVYFCHQKIATCDLNNPLK